MFYIAYLLTNPFNEPLSAIDLAAKIPEIYRKQLGLSQLVDPITGQVTPTESHARIQERSFSLDDAQAMRKLLRKQTELEALLDSDDQSEPVKQEALRELEDIAEFERKYSHSKRDSSQRATDAVRAAIRRVQQKLAKSTDLLGNPHPVLHPFAAHLQKYLIIPSGSHHPSGTTANRLIYEPPPGVRWHSP